MVERLYVPPERLAPRIVLTGREAHHLRHVKRCRAGEEVEVFTGDGYNYRGHIVEVTRSGLVIHIEGREPGRREPRVRVSVAVPVPRGKRMDTLVEKLSELGVAELWPTETARSVVRAGAVSAARYQHWQRIAVESARQSGRTTVLRIHQGRDLRSVSAALRERPLRLVAALGGEAEPLAQVLGGRPAGEVAIFIGPEGDFDEEELEMLRAAGAVPVGLGPTVLRVETAAIVAAAAVMLWAEAAAGPHKEDEE